MRVKRLLNRLPTNHIHKRLFAASARFAAPGASHAKRQERETAPSAEGAFLFACRTIRWTLDVLRTCQRSSRPNACCSPQNAKRPLPLGDILFARGVGEGSLHAEGGAIGGGPEDAKEPGEPGLVFKKPARRRDRETADQPPVSGQPNKRIGRFQAVIATSIDGRWPTMGCDSKTRYEAITAVRDGCSLRRAAARTGVSEQRKLPTSRRFP